MASPVIISSYEYRDRLHLQDNDQTIKLRSFIPALDIALDGFELGELIVLSGPTKHGKSLFFQTLTNNFLEESEIYSLWFTYELPPRQLFSRFPKLPLFYLPEELQGHSLPWIGDCIKAAKEKTECKAVFIDHLHYLLDLGRIKNTSLEIGAVIRGLKQLAIRHGVVIFLACHMKKTLNDREPNQDDIRDCIPAGQIIQSPDGTSFAIENAKKGMTVFSRKSVKNLQSDVITDVWKSGKKNIYKLITKTGREILASDGHKFYAMSHNKGGTFGPNQKKGIQGWTELKNLKIGQKIACVRKYNIDNIATLTEQQALVLGWIVGHGHIAKNYSSEVTVSTLQECRILKKIADEAWSLMSKYAKHKDKNAFRFYLTSGRMKNKLSQYFRENNFRSTGNQKHTPKDIFTQPQRVVAAYLRGLFQADGSINFAGKKSNPMVVITLSTISEILAKEVKSLLLRIGIIGTIRAQNMKNSGFRTKNSNSFIISITGQDILIFMKEIGFLAKKMERAEKIVSQWKPKELSRQWDICYERVKSIEYIGEMDTYDVSVRGHHCNLINNSFCIQDILTHNSSFVAQESDVAMMIWRCKEKNQYTNAAKLKIETSRRAGIFGKIIPLEKKNGLLYERTASPISTV